MTDISVIVPTYRSSHTLSRCLTSVAAAVRSSDEIIVVADGCQALDLATARKFEVRLLTLPQQSGPSRARNLGANAARGDILFFLDSDVTIPNGTIDRIHEIFAEDPELTAVIGSYDDDPAEHNFLSQYRNLLHHYVHQTSSSRASTFWSGCGAIRRDAFLAQGGFNENYSFPSVEDIELGYRLIGSNHKIKLDKSLQVKHHKRWDASTLLKTDIYHRAIPWAKLILKHHTLIDDLNLTKNSRLSVFFVGMSLVFFAGSLRQRSFLQLALACLVFLLFLNRNLYSFFVSKRGIPFTVLAVFWHWLYYLYSGFAFAGVLIYHHTLQLRNHMKPSTVTSETVSNELRSQRQQ